MKRMIQKVKFLALLLFIAVNGFAQDYSLTKKIAPDKLKADFSILITSLRENHPGLYDFISKAQFDSLATHGLSAIKDSLTEDEFHVHVRKFIRVIGCGHTTAKPSEDWYKFVRSQNGIIPVHIFLQNDQLYIRKITGNADHVSEGARLVAVNGVQADEILSELKTITGHDGVGETMINRNVERLFQTLHAFVYGLHEVYEIDVEFESGIRRQFSLNGGKATKYSVEKPIEFNSEIGIKDAKFGIVGKSKRMAILKLGSFPMKGYKKFYKKVFKRLSDFDTIPLVIDLRSNGGGYFPNGNQLLRYLMNDKFTMDLDKPQKHTKNNKHLKLDVASHMTRFLLSTIPDRNKEDPDRNYQIRFKPIKKRHFEGDLYILTDGMTFSTGSFVTSKLKNARGAVVVGEETGGGEVGFNAVLTWKLKLPNSGVRITVPIYHVDIQPEREDVGRGVVPNVPIEYDLEERIFDVDLEIKAIMQLLGVE